MSAICVEETSLAETGQYASLIETDQYALLGETTQYPLLSETGQYALIASRDWPGDQSVCYASRDRSAYALLIETVSMLR